MSFRSLLSRVFTPSAVRAAEGEYRPGPYHLPITGGWLPDGSAWNFWQLGQDPISGSGSAMVEACVSAYSQTVAMCPGSHWKTLDNGGRERITTSALYRIIRKPNDYQTISDFLLNLTRSLYMTGNAYALAVRNERYEITELHLMDSRQSAALIAETGEVFYALGGNEIIEKRVGAPILGGVPARDVLHIRLHTPRHPLRGESPLSAVSMDVAANGAMTAQQFLFYSNQSRPSQVLSSDLILTKEQVTQLREMWNEQSRGLNQGGVPILSGGLKPINLAQSAHDGQLAEMMKLTEQHIALAFRMPLQILGIGGTPFASTEILMQSWVASGLGFALNHIEEGFGQLFALKGQPEEYLELDTASLLRSAHKDRIEAFARGVQGGIYSPNEARAEFELSEAQYGDEPRVQQQVVPLSAAAAIPAAPPSPPAAPAVSPEKDEEPEGNADENERILQSFRSAHARTIAA